MEEQLILISPDSKTEVASIPPEGKTVTRIAYEVLIENPYLYTEQEFMREVHIVRRKCSNLKINKYSIKRSDLLKKFGWGVHKDSNGKMALVAVDSDHYRRLSKEISTVYAYRTKADPGKQSLLQKEKSPFNELEYDLAAINSDSQITQTQKESLINARVGQGKYRQNLLGMWKECAVSGCKTKNLLVASHIKPWRDSSNDERLDKFNGLLLLANIDKAFDSGLISFNALGKIIISKKLKDFKAAGISLDMKVNLTAEHKYYMQYHRQHIFKA
ncbi:DUF6157 family protein [Pseudoalteromonas arctica]|uniref:DUF6157 family protein n=1 Tax=Pseudoalteromonas arctica TaxID=394751 RepID=A0ABU9TFE2_9GAMM